MPCPAADVEFSVRGDFVEWLAASRGTLAATTYNSGRLILLAADRRGLSLEAKKFARPMGLAYDGRRLALAVREPILH